MLSPYWLFAVPAGLLGTTSLAILTVVAVDWLTNTESDTFWQLLGDLSGGKSHAEPHWRYPGTCRAVVRHS